ncbi:MAG: hypothetical protein Q4C96_06710, partial [Planctomycetia bacterium]|nr:hypothetical protein [Planctomycetia bacterium]
PTKREATENISLKLYRNFLRRAGHLFTSRRFPKTEFPAPRTPYARFSDLSPPYVYFLKKRWGKTRILHLKITFLENTKHTDVYAFFTQKIPRTPDET